MLYRKHNTGFDTVNHLFFINVNSINANKVYPIKSSEGFSKSQPKERIDLNQNMLHSVHRSSKRTTLAHTHVAYLELMFNRKVILNDQVKLMSG